MNHASASVSTAPLDGRQKLSPGCLMTMSQLPNADSFTPGLRPHARTLSLGLCGLGQKQLLLLHRHGSEAASGRLPGQAFATPRRAIVAHSLDSYIRHTEASKPFQQHKDILNIE